MAPSFYNPFRFCHTDRCLSLLPLAHIFARSVTLICIRWNMGIYYFNDLKNIVAACQEVRPTVTCFVPRLIEKIYAKMVAKLNEGGFLKRSIGNWAFSIARDGKSALLPLADKLVYKTVRDLFGGQLRVVVSGAAPLNPILNRFFNTIGIPLYEGYGLTEAMIATVNYPGNCKVGTVGPSFPGVEIKTTSEGEIIVRGDNVFKEYYKNPQATLAVLDKNGWLHTGDKGTIDNDGYLKIVGRIRELVKSSVGEWIAPVPLEQELSSAPFIEFAMVIAERRKFVSALIFPNFDVVHALKKFQQVENLSDEEYLNGPYIKQEMDRLIEVINAHCNHWEQIHAYRFVMDPPTIGSGELTPSMKIRRDVVESKYTDLIDSMYPEESILPHAA